MCRGKWRVVEIKYFPGHFPFAASKNMWHLDPAEMQKLRSKELTYQMDFYLAYKVNPSKLALSIELEMPNSRSIRYLITGCMSGYICLGADPA